MRLSEIQREIDAWIMRFEEGYWPPHVNLARLVEEVGELARELNHEVGPKKKRDDEATSSAADELADVILAAVTLANTMDIDLEHAVRTKLDKMIHRDADRWTKRTSPPDTDPADTM